MRKLRYFMLLLASLTAGAANAAGVADHADLALQDALREEGYGEQFVIRLDEAAMAALPAKADGVTAELEDSSDKGSFTALLYPSEGKADLAPLKVSGTFEEVLEVPVLSRRLGSGEVIGADDVTMKAMAASRVRDGMATDKEQLVGKAVRRTVSEGRTVRMSELEQPKLIAKGQLITMRYIAGAMEIQALGEAMEDGAEGEVIRVRNSDSRAVVQANVESAKLVSVQPLLARNMQLSQK